jgi:hypothetical protein
MREIDIETVEWTLHAHLLAAIYDVLTVANYQRTDGKGPKPKPLVRPGVGQPKRRGTPHTRKEVWRALRGTDPPEGVTDG